MPPDILAKIHGRYLDHVWCRNPTTLNRSKLTRQTHLCNRQISQAKSAYCSKIITEHSGDHRSLWKAFTKILHQYPKLHLLDHSSTVALVNTLSSFFMNKISVINSSYPSDLHSHALNPPNTRKVLQSLTCVTANKVHHLVLLAPYTSSDLDPIPTSVVQACSDILITPIIYIINLSLTEGYFPSHFKSALVSPLLKKPTLNKDIMNNYRPVSSLSYFSKALEKVVVNQVNSHVTNSSTFNQYQSAYRKFHSTETTLPKIHYDILASMDAGKVTELTLLVLSAASMPLVVLSFQEDLMIILGLLGSTHPVQIISDWKMPEGWAGWLFVLQGWSHLRSPSGVSFRSSAFHPLYHSTE